MINESGVFFTASDRLGEIGGFIQLLDGTKGWYEDSCTLDGRMAFWNQGARQIWGWEAHEPVTERF